MQKYYAHGNVENITSNTVVKRERSSSTVQSKHNSSNNAAKSTSFTVVCDVQFYKDEKQKIEMELDKQIKENDSLSRENTNLINELRQMKERNSELLKIVSDLKYDLEQAKRREHTNSDKENDIYEVEKILAHKRVKGSKLRFKVHWLNYDSSHDSWLSEKDLNCDEMLHEYKIKNNLSI